MKPTGSLQVPSACQQTADACARPRHRCTPAPRLQGCLHKRLHAAASPHPLCSQLLLPHLSSWRWTCCARRAWSCRWGKARRRASGTTRRHLLTSCRPRTPGSPRCQTRAGTLVFRGAGRRRVRNVGSTRGRMTCMHTSESCRFHACQPTQGVAVGSLRKWPQRPVCTHAFQRVS